MKLTDRPSVMCTVSRVVCLERVSDDVDWLAAGADESVYYDDHDAMRFWAFMFTLWKSLQRDDLDYTPSDVFSSVRVPFTRVAQDDT